MAGKPRAAQPCPGESVVDDEGPPAGSLLLDGCSYPIFPEGAFPPHAKGVGRLDLEGCGPFVVAARSGRPIPLQRLTRQEREIAWLVADGLLTERIAHRLGPSPDTVGAHVNRIYARLGCHNPRRDGSGALRLAPS